MSAGQAHSDLMAADRYEVLLTSVAKQDVTSICDHIAEFDSPASADHVLDRLMKAVDGSSSLPERGGHPKNLLSAPASAFGYPVKDRSGQAPGVKSPH
jgi:plasmid stabilization system protein ParE